MTDSDSEVTIWRADQGAPIRDVVKVIQIRTRSSVVCALAGSTGDIGVSSTTIAYFPANPVLGPYFCPPLKKIKTTTHTSLDNKICGRGHTYLLDSRSLTSSSWGTVVPCRFDPRAEAIPAALWCPRNSIPVHEEGRTHQQTGFSGRPTKRERYTYL